MRLTQTYSQLRLVTADALALRAQQAAREMPVSRGQVHEFFGMGAGEGVPLTVMLGLAARTLQPSERLVFLGRACWPTFQVLAAMLELASSDRENERGGKSEIENQKSKMLFSRCLFLDPPSARERFWALAEALRCPGVGVVIGDGEGLDATASRRLQLAAEARPPAHGPLALLARPDAARDRPSWAATRWQVRPWHQQRPPPLARIGEGPMEVRPGNAPLSALPDVFSDSLSTRMSWELTLTSSRHGGGAGHAPRRWIFSWTYQVFRGTGARDLSAAVGHSTAQTPLAQPA